MMTKQEFLKNLRNGLKGLPQNEIDERVDFYREMIDDWMEEGMSEQEAVDVLGSTDEVISQIILETPLAKLVKERIKPKRSLTVWEIILLILGSPIWLSVLISLFAVILSVYITLWSVIISLYATNLSLAVCGIAALLLAIYYFVLGNTTGVLCAIGAVFVCIGFTILMFFACKLITKWMILLTKKMFVWIKSLFIRKEKTK